MALLWRCLDPSSWEATPSPQSEAGPGGAAASAATPGRALSTGIATSGRAVPIGRLPPLLLAPAFQWHCACSSRPPAPPCSTLIWVHTFTTHNSPRYWHQADQFLPERFLQPGAEYASSGPGQQGQAAARGGAAPADHAGGLHSGGASSLPPGDSPRGGGIGGGGAASQPLRFFPFSQGARDCIGQSLAKINYTATLAALLGRYSFKLAPEVSGTAPPVGVFGVEGGSAGGACGDPNGPCLNSV